jgi:hypothetical protein
MASATQLNIPAMVQELIRKYVELQHTYNQYSEKLSQIREAKKQSEQRLITAISQNGLSGFGITYQGNKLTLAQETTYDTLTYKFLEECLFKLYGGDNEKVKKVILFIKKQRLAHREQIIKISGTAASRSRPSTPHIDRD